MDSGSEGLSQWRTTTLREVFDNYQLVGVESNPGYIIVTERPKQLANPPNISAAVGIRELGYTSMSPWTAWTRDELNPKLRDKQGIRTYYDMKRNDGTVRGSLRLVKTPIQSAHWFLDPASDSAIDKNIKDYVEENLFKLMNVDWPTLLGDILLMFEYGYMTFEKVYDFHPKKPDKLILRKLAPRHPLDIQEWIFDSFGGPAGLVMEPFVPYGTQYDGVITPIPTNDIEGSLRVGQFIPINKLVVFSLEAEAGDLRGISVLRSAYKHWYYKDTFYKIDAIQKERHGIGIPIIMLPPGFSDDDKKLAEELGRNLRTNDKAHIVVPANWQIMFAELKGQPVSALESINHHNDQIKENVLGTFIGDAKAGDSIIDVFYKSVRYMADAVASIFNKHIIPQLVDLNFRNGDYPTLRARRIGEWDDLRTLTFALRNLVGAGLVTPDDPLEAQLREESDLPPMDKATSRIVSGPPITHTPDNPNQVDQPGGPQDVNKPMPAQPPKVGLPRQQPTPPVGPPRANAGRDSSGGKA